MLIYIQALAHLCMWTNSQDSAEFYALNSTQYEVGGRAAEVAAVNFENLSIHSLEEFGKEYQILAINIMKDKQEQGLTQDLEIFIHRDCWELDWYFAIAVRTVLFDEDSQFLFPKFQTQVRILRKDGNVDSKVSDLWSSTFATLMELLDGYGDLLTDSMFNGLNRDLSSHSQKRCAAQVRPACSIYCIPYVLIQGLTFLPFQTLAESGVGGLQTIFRLGWVVRNLYSIFDYIIVTSAMTRHSGKVQAGWNMKLPGENYGGYPPRYAPFSVKFYLLINISYITPADCLPSIKWTNRQFKVLSKDFSLERLNFPMKYRKFWWLLYSGTMTSFWSRSKTNQPESLRELTCPITALFSK